jgi:MFS family permease
MYQSDSVPVVLPPPRWRHWTRGWRFVTPNVWFLGMTSLLTDVSSEMIASVLPIYLVLHLNLSPLAFGTLDGLYNGVTALTRWVSGVLADRWGRHKEVAAAGYAISALSRLGLLAAGRAWSGLALAIASDRLGKGIRTVPRDALISLSASPSRLGYSFGVHRALDATGALLGPVVAVVLLGLVPGGFDVVFVTSFCVAVVGLGVLLLFVENVAVAADNASAVRQPTLRVSVGLLAAPDFRVVVITASLLALFTISDAFVYLVLQQRTGFNAGLFPLLFVGTALSYLLLAIPAGWLADRVGRARMFLLGHGLLFAVYALLLVPSDDPLRVFLAVILLGAYYAATDGVLMAVASGMLPPGLRGSGFALLTTATSLCRLIASIAFGWLWTAWDAEVAITSFVVALACGISVAIVTLGRRPLNVHG